ncbi:MAG: tail fiber protein [Candidatus Riflebacteria bacterium]|nr:tail fiber protein [Candidatus Riflebacteria bacterium]
MPKINKAKIVFLIFMIEAILSLSFFKLYADTQPKPQRPWYSETPNPRHIANYDRLTAEYFNNQLNVIYNWAQNTNAELDNLLHNGIGVASLTVGILNCTNKILSPALELQGRTQPSPPVNNGMIYFDSELQRFRVYQENAWRDLSSNIVIASDSLNNPLVIQGYISASNIYATESAVINKNLTVKGKLNASGPATLESLKVSKTLKVPVTASTTLGVGSVYYDTSENKLKILNSSNQWKTVSVDVDSVLSATSTNPVQNKIITAKINQTDADLINGMAATLQQSYNYANGIATQAYNYANNVASDAQTATQNYSDTQLGILRSYVSQQLGSGTSDLYVKSIKTTNASVTNKLDAYDLKATNTFVLPDYNNVGAGSHASYFSGIGGALLGVDTASGTLKYTYYSPIHHTTYANNTLATVDKTVSDVATSTVNGTITVTKNGTATNVSVKGLGSAAYANVASFSAANHNHDSSYVSDIATGTASGTIAFTKNGVATNIKVVGNTYSVPIGTVLPYFGRRYVGDPIPEGFLLCDGSLVSKNDYPELFNVVGYSLDDHQSGEYFALPDLTGRFLMGRSQTDVHASTVGKYVEPGLPNITGEIKAGAFEASGGVATSAIYTTVNYSGSEGGFQNYGMALDASRCNSIYGHSDTVQPPALVCNYIIKAY